MVCTDIGCGFLTANMLFAGSQGQHETSISVDVDGLSHQAPRHVAHIFHAGGEHAQGRPAKGTRDSQTLSFSRHDVGSLAAGIFKHAVSQGLAEPYDAEGLFLPGDVPDGLEVFNTAEKIRRLNGHRRQVIQTVKGSRIGATVRKIGKFHNLITGGSKICFDHPAIIRVDQTRHRHFFSP